VACALLTGGVGAAQATASFDHHPAAWAAASEQRVHPGGLRTSKIFDGAEDELEQYPVGIHAIPRESGPKTWTATMPSPAPSGSTAAPAGP